LTGQQGIHGFWESRIPELFAEKEWDFYLGKATYIEHPLSFTWQRMLESAVAADSVLRIEKQLSQAYTYGKYAFEPRNGVLVRQYSSAYTTAYNQRLNNMVERRMRDAIQGVASFWYTAWVNAGQPDLRDLTDRPFTEEENTSLDELNINWKNIKMPPLSCDGPVDSL
ncbi:MAG TPA: S1/P1 Nuclease, partial [Flavisolibacter sp.]|nr:S1/P1 Nuclease [Flavisolibacter sp.]